MEVNITHSRKMVNIWLSNADRTDKEVQEKLELFYDEYKQRGYMVAVFQSGNQELSGLTLDMLRYNRRMLAEKELREEREQIMEQRM